MGFGCHLHLFNQAVSLPLCSAQLLLSLLHCRSERFNLFPQKFVCFPVLSFALTGFGSGDYGTIPLLRCSSRLVSQRFHLFHDIKALARGNCI